MRADDRGIAALVGEEAHRSAVVSFESCATSDSIRATRASIGLSVDAGPAANSMSSTCAEVQRQRRHRARSGMRTPSTILRGFGGNFATAAVALQWARVAGEHDLARGSGACAPSRAPERGACLSAVQAGDPHTRGRDHHERLISMRFDAITLRLRRTPRSMRVWVQVRHPS